MILGTQKIKFSVALAIPKQKIKFKTQEEFENRVSENAQFADRRFEFINVKIYRGNTVCNAKPVLPDFSFKVKDMFAE